VHESRSRRVGAGRMWLIWDLKEGLPKVQKAVVKLRDNLPPATRGQTPAG
jgi:hypothetical protein